MLKRFGAFDRALDSRWRARRLLILCYHGIALEDEHEWDPNLYMPVETFHARMELVRRMGCAVLPLAEGIERLYSGTLPERSVSITFDDGFYGFFWHALPILRSFHFPVTLYLTTFYSGFNQPWFPLIVSYLLWKRRGDLIASGEADIPALLDLRTAESRERIAAGMDRLTRERNFTAEDKNDLARRLAHVLEVDYDRLHEERILHLMTPDEVKSAAADGARIELHTHHHQTPLDRNLFCREIQENSVFIEAVTGTRPQHFCYPNGMHRPEFLPWLRNHGVMSGTTCHPGLASIRHDPLLLPRLVDGCGLSELEFESWLSGIGAVTPMARALVRAASRLISTPFPLSANPRQ